MILSSTVSVKICGSESTTALTPLVAVEPGLCQESLPGQAGQRHAPTQASGSPLFQRDKIFYV